MIIKSIGLAALISITPSVFSAPMIYTFSGNVGESAWNYQFRVGDPIQYKFLVDFDRPGEVHVGQTIQYSTSVTLDDGVYNYFYAELIEGPTINWSGTYTEGRAFVGINRYTNGAVTLSALLSYTDDSYRNFVWVPSDPCCKEVQSWVVGDHFSSDNEVHNSNERNYGDGSSAWIYSSLYLTSIENYQYPSVPEPSEFLLFGLGLISLLAYSIRPKIR